MNTAWVEGIRKIVFRDIPKPKPEEGEVTVKIMACGICGTDIHFYNDYPAGKPTPLGHEVSGYIDEVGKDVSDLKAGDKVIVQNHIPCGKCFSCLNGDYSLCTNIQTYMDNKPAMAEYIKIKREMVVPFEHLSFIEAAIAEPLTVALDICREAELDRFRRVCISGPGTIGLCCIRIAHLSAAHSITVLGRRFSSNRSKIRIQTAKEMGADRVYDTDTVDWKEMIKNDTPEGFERIIITSPPSTIPETFELASFGAVIAFNGISFREENITFNANRFHFQKLKLKASHAIPNWGFPMAFALFRDKKIPAERLVTHTFSFTKLEQAFKVATDADKPVVKVVITFS